MSRRRRSSVFRKSDNPSITRDVSSEGVQQALAKLMEGKNKCATRGGRKHPQQEFLLHSPPHFPRKCETSFHHQPEAQHYKIFSYPHAGRPITPSTGVKRTKLRQVKIDLHDPKPTCGRFGRDPPHDVLG